MELNSNNFQSFLHSNDVVLVDFWADWCPPCKMMLPIVDSLSLEYPIGKVNTTENILLAKEFGIASIPAFIFFKNGEEVERLSGMQTKEQLIYVFEDLNK